MPAKKTLSLVRGHLTNAQKQKRAKNEEKLFARIDKLSTNPPSELKGNIIGSKMWKRVITRYQSIDAVIVTKLDEETILQFCVMVSELKWFDGIRGTVESEYNSVQAQLKKYSKSSNLTDADYKRQSKLRDQFVALTGRLQSMDQRLEGKRKFLLTLSQALLLTPRSRSGVAPEQSSEKTEEPSEMEKLLSEI